MDDRSLKQLLAKRYATKQPPKAKEAYQDFCASELYCPQCKQSMPVKEKELLALPGGTLFDYLCAKCGTSLGTRKS